MSKSLLLSAFVFALSVAGCDDDEPLNPTNDGGNVAETGRADTATGDAPRADVAVDTSGADGGDARPADASTDAPRADAGVGTDAPRVDAVTGDVLVPNLDTRGDAADASSDAVDGGLDLGTDLGIDVI